MPTFATVKGGKELSDLLRQLPNRVQRNVTGNAMRGGARVIATEAKALVPVDTGQLRRSIVVRAAKRVRGGVGAVVGILRPRSRIAHLIEFGTRRSAAHPFLRPALDAKGPEAIRKIGEIAGKGIEREAAKLKR